MVRSLEQHSCTVKPVARITTDCSLVASAIRPCNQRELAAPSPSRRCRPTNQPGQPQPTTARVYAWPRSSASSCTTSEFVLSTYQPTCGQRGRRSASSGPPRELNLGTPHGTLPPSKCEPIWIQATVTKSAWGSRRPVGSVRSKHCVQPTCMHTVTQVSSTR